MLPQLLALLVAALDPIHCLIVPFDWLGRLSHLAHGPVLAPYIRLESALLHLLLLPLSL